MSLSATMWTSVSGLLSHGSKMNTIGNNIANINTVAYKSQRMDFADFVYQNGSSLSGTVQNGFGVQVGTIMTNFSQGSFESTTNATDLAISGNGYFQVNKIGTDEAYYTRAGNFNFNSDGYLIDPNGFALQGWQIDNSGGVTQATGSSILTDTSVSTTSILGTGSPTDIKLDTWYVYPQQTTTIDVMVNLPQAGSDNATNSVNPFTALLNMWDGTQPPATDDTPAISQSSYSNQTTMTVYDEAGVQHTLTIYFDQISSDDYAGGSTGETMWEYIVTMDPAEDMRQFYDETTGELTYVNETSMGGVLMAGTMTFSSSGALTNQSAYTWGGTQTPETDPDSFEAVADPAGGLEALNVISLDPTDLNNWEPAAISSSGYPITVANFSGILDAQTTGTEAGSAYNLQIDFGLNASNLSSPWSTSGSLADLDVPSYTYNSAYTASNSVNGPEYVLLNTDYNSSSVDNWDLSTNKYSVGGTSLWTTDGVNVPSVDVYNALVASGSPLTYDANGAVISYDDYAKSLEYYNITTVSISANSISTDLNQPSSDLTLNLITGELTDAGGNTLSADGTYSFSSLNGLTYTTVQNASGVNVTNFYNSDGDLAYRYNADNDTYYDMSSGTAVAMTADEVAAVGLFDPNNVTEYFGMDTLDYDTIMSTASTQFSSALDSAVNKGTPTNLYLLSEATPANANYLASFVDPVIAPDASTSLSGDFTSTTSQDGYGFGSLTGWSFDTDGVLYGIYSNGVTLGLWQVSLYDFTNDQGLNREGGNLFSETADSGSPTLGSAGSAGLGSISSYSLEQSNVDMSTEFVYMITTQRGYQSNSKLITTTDTMLETVINMKR